MDRIGAAGGSPTGTISGGVQGWIDENLSVGQEGTEIVAAYENAVQEELMHLLSLASITPDISNWTQVAQAIQAITPFQNVVIYTSTTSGTFTVPAGKTLGELTVVGGGGAGGPGLSGAGGGGAAGGFVKGVVPLTPGAAISAVVGAGGAGAGTAGGASNFGTLVACGGGQAGASGSGGGIAAGGATGGSVSVAGSLTNMVQLAGQAGRAGFSISSGPQVGGEGGASGFGAGQPGGVCISGGTATAANGIVFGGGGGGGAGAGNGGQGGPGIIILRY